jgi:hypothetical protein
VSDLLADEQSEEVAVGPGALFRSARDVPADAAHVCEVKPPQQCFELLLGEGVIAGGAHWSVSGKRIGRWRACST